MSVTCRAAPEAICPSLNSYPDISKRQIVKIDAIPIMISANVSFSISGRATRIACAGSGTKRAPSSIMGAM
jgi:hypothetical protein